jgi:hypothetical protein
MYSAYSNNLGEGLRIRMAQPQTADLDIALTSTISKFAMLLLLFFKRLKIYSSDSLIP